jgi:hypothetical protein
MCIEDSRNLNTFSNLTYKFNGRIQMIRILTQLDFESLRAYLSKDQIQNIYLIHRLQTYGLNGKKPTFWGAFEQDRLEGALLIDNTRDKNVVGYPVSSNSDILGRFGKLALKCGVNKLIGEKSIIEHAIKELNLNSKPNIDNLNFIKIYPDRFVPPNNYHHDVRIARNSDIPLLVELYKDFEWKKKNRDPREVKKEIHKVMDESGKYFLLEIDGRVVSANKIFPETDKAGISGSSRTLPEFRGREIFLSVQTASMEYLFNQGKIAVGFIEESNSSMHKVVVDKQGGIIAAKWLVANFNGNIINNQRPIKSRLKRFFL